MEVTPRAPAGGGPAAAPGRRSRSPFLRGSPPTRARVWPTLLGLAGLGLIVLVTTSLLGENGWSSYRSLRRERAALAAEVDSLRLRHQELARSIERLRSDPETLERIAREKYGMLGQGEQIIEVIGEENLEGKLPVAPPPGDRPKLGTPPPPAKNAAAKRAAAGVTAKGAAKSGSTATKPAAGSAKPAPAPKATAGTPKPNAKATTTRAPATRPPAARAPSNPAVTPPGTAGAAGRQP